MVGLPALDEALRDGADTTIVISCDSLRTAQAANAAEVQALRRFLDDPDHLAFICPHHVIGEVPELAPEQTLQRQQIEFLHHGDKTIPPRQRFGGFARSLLAGLGVPVENRFGLRPAARGDGQPMPIEAERDLDRLQLLRGVETLNLHAHLPHFERLDGGIAGLEILARQRIAPDAPPHPFTRDGRTTFDALLQSRPGTFPGTLIVGDATLWSSTAGGVESLQRLWGNVLQR